MKEWRERLKWGEVSPNMGAEVTLLRIVSVETGWRSVWSSLNRQKENYKTSK